MKGHGHALGLPQNQEIPKLPSVLFGFPFAPSKTQQEAQCEVELDPSFGGALIYAPADVARVIRQELASTFSLPEDARPGAEVVEALRSEVARLQEEPGVLRALGPELMAVAEERGLLAESCWGGEDGAELFVPTESTGPWTVTLVVTGPTGTAYEAYLRLQLKANSAWPKAPAEVRVHSWIHNPLISKEGVLDEAALAEALADHSDALSPLCRTLRAARALLSAPGIDEEEAEDAAESNRQRCEVVAQYSHLRKHRNLFELDAYSAETLHPEFWKAFSENTAEAWSAIMTSEASEVYSFPLFNRDFCAAFIEEMDSFHGSGLPARRPNSMNNYGIVVNEIGMEPALDQLVHTFLQPVAQHLFRGVGSHVDRHHTFVVRYKVGEDLGLDMHTDDSDVTFNVCLGKDFKGAGLQFCGNQGAPDHRHASLCYQHQLGRCVVHRGHRRHGADDITEGERLNLILWTRNIEYRRSRYWSRHNLQSRSTGYQRETGPPDKVCLSFTHDRDYGVFKDRGRSANLQKGLGFQSRGQHLADIKHV
ncbi:unnamed protein product [Effrenium voratum]|nr:unnamed protein product [Effrenium voratum]